MNKHTKLVAEIENEKWSGLIQGKKEDNRFNSNEARQIVDIHNDSISRIQQIIIQSATMKPRTADCKPKIGTRALLSFDGQISEDKARLLHRSIYFSGMYCTKKITHWIEVTQPLMPKTV
jgi:reverse gyrase